MTDLFSNPFVIGIVAGVFTGVSMLPQLAMIIHKKKAADISLGMLLILLCGVGLWVYYGILKKDWPIIATNAFSFAVNLLILFFSLKYKKKNGAS
jgi:MtN3 and saliva related transmembrane protein